MRLQRRGTTGRRPALARRAAALLAVVAALALTGCSAFPSAGPVSTPSPTATNGGTAGTVPAGPTAAVIGDSIAVGWNVPAADAWPLVAATRLGWNLTDFAEGGAGFTRPGVNTHDFDDQVSAVIRLRPQIVIVAATVNDAATAASSPTTVKQSTAAAIERLSAALPDTTIIGLGAVWGSTKPPASASVIDDALKTAVLSAGGHWLAIGQTFLGRADLMQPDDVHPNSAGQELLGRTVADAIAKAGIEPGTRGADDPARSATRRSSAHSDLSVSAV